MLRAFFCRFGLKVTCLQYYISCDFSQPHMIIKKLSSLKVPWSVSYLESFANFPFSEININHAWFCPPPPVGVAQLRPHSYDEPAPATEQDVVMDRRVLSTWLSSTSSRLAPESAGSTKVPTCLVTLSSLYGTSTTSQCTSICWMVKGAPQKLIFQNLFKQTYHPNLLSIYVTYLLLQSTILSNFAHLILPIWVFCHHSLSLSLSFSFTSHLLNISSVSNKLTNYYLSAKISLAKI